VSEQYLPTIVSIVHSLNFFGYNNETARSDFCVLLVLYFYVIIKVLEMLSNDRESPLIWAKNKVVTFWMMGFGG
jgi:hypothetical protein